MPHFSGGRGWVGGCVVGWLVWGFFVLVFCGFFPPFYNVSCLPSQEKTVSGVCVGNLQLKGFSAPSPPLPLISINGCIFT